VQALLGGTSIALQLSVTLPATVGITTSPAEGSMGLPPGRRDRAEKGSQRLQPYPETTKLTRGTALAVLYCHQCQSTQRGGHRWGWEGLARLSLLTLPRLAVRFPAHYYSLVPATLAHGEGRRGEKTKREAGLQADGKGEEKPARTIFYACN